MQRAGLQRKDQQEQGRRGWSLHAKDTVEVGVPEERPGKDKEMWKILGNKPEALNLCEAASKWCLNAELLKVAKQSEVKVQWGVSQFLGSGWLNGLCRARTGWLNTQVDYVNAEKALWLVDLAVHFHGDCLSFNPSSASSSSVKFEN